MNYKNIQCTIEENENIQDEICKVSAWKIQDETSAWRISDASPGTASANRKPRCPEREDEQVQENSCDGLYEGHHKPNKRNGL